MKRPPKADLDDDFDGYRKWLGVSSANRPPTHYELLGIKSNETDREVIQSAIDQRRQFVESKRSSGHDSVVTEILYRINEAESTLLDYDLRQDYDRQNSISDKRRKKRRTAADMPRSSSSSPRVERVVEDDGLVGTFGGIAVVICVAFGIMAWLSFHFPWSRPRNAPQQSATGTSNVRSNQGSDKTDDHPNPNNGVPNLEKITHWKFWDVFRKGFKKDQAYTVNEEGTIVCSRDFEGWCLTSQQEFSEFDLTLEFLFKSGVGIGNPSVNVASTLPNPEATAWKAQVPQGIEISLVPLTAGQIVLPREAFTVELAAGQTKEGRKVHCLRRPQFNIGNWNKFEVRCTKDRKLFVMINETPVNQLAQIESFSGYLVIWPANSEMQLRNVAVTSSRGEEQLSFEHLE